MLIKNKNLRYNEGVILESLIQYKEYLISLSIYTNKEIEKLCESYYSGIVSSFVKENDAQGIPSTDELFKIHQQNYKKGGIYSDSF